MASVLSQDLGVILKNYSDVIEGGNTYRGSGTEYNGFPGLYSHDEYDGTEMTSDDGGNTTTFQQGEVLTALSSRIVRADAPPFFAYCTSATNSLNDDVARKITGITGASNEVALETALPDDTTIGDTFELREGFKRVPDHVDIEGEDGFEDGFDRYFQFTMLPGSRMSWYGNGVETYESTLELRLRILNKARARNAKASAVANLLFMRSILTRPDHRDGTYVQLLDAVDAPEPEAVVEDNIKTVVVDRYRIIYRVNSSFS